ncbi:hypothetical protein ABPG75_006343 [Micractinium tetrahymenae]
MGRLAPKLLVAGLLLLSLGALLASLAVPLAAFIESKVQQAIRKQVVWQPDSPRSVAERYHGDQDPPLYVAFRFFNITNVEDVRKGAKAVLEEVGPYVFAKSRRRRGATFVRGGGAVRYHNYEYHTFVPELSSGSPDDRVTTLNVPLVGALEVIQSKAGSKVGYLLKLLASLVEGWGDRRVHGLFTTRTVAELLWGYEDQLLAELNRWVPKLTIDPRFRLVGNTSSPEEADAAFAIQANTGAPIMFIEWICLGSEVTGRTRALALLKSGARQRRVPQASVLCSPPAGSSCAAGLEDLSLLWETEQWKNVTEVTCWAEGHVERVHGTDAAQFRPGLKLNDSVHVWVGDLYRATQLIAAEEVNANGVPLLRLRPDPSILKPDPRYFQTIQGLMNISGPAVAGPTGSPDTPGPPIFLSYPHFCGADPSLAQGVEGLHCKPEYLDLYLDVEPSTGVTLRAAQRLMMVSWFGGKWGVIDGKARDTFLPIFWVEATTEAGAAQMRAFAPLLRARAAESALRRWGHPAGLGLAIAAVAPLIAAAVLWSGDGGSEEAAATAVGSGYERLEAGAQPPLGHARQAAAESAALAENGEQQAAKQREPASFPVAAEQDGEPDGVPSG